MSAAHLDVCRPWDGARRHPKSTRYAVVFGQPTALITSASAPFTVTVIGEFTETSGIRRGRDARRDLRACWSQITNLCDQSLTWLAGLRSQTRDQSTCLSRPPDQSYDLRGCAGLYLQDERSFATSEHATQRRVFGRGCSAPGN